MVTQQNKNKTIKEKIRNAERKTKLKEKNYRKRPHK